jgi:LAO/AO transport system kinase
MNIKHQNNMQNKIKLAKIISKIENEHPDTEKILNDVWHNVGSAYRIGITGPPGVGKSTLVDKIALQLSEQNLKIAIVSVDPSSPFGGGALLGDRIRMNELSLNPNIFIRSLATRGSLGGLSVKTQDICDVIDSFGYDIILIETVGVGQIELDIVEASDITTVVLVPESGDDIQSMKSGLMEIGNIFVINKSDRDGANSLETNINSMIQLKKQYKNSNDYDIPVIQTVATKNKNIDLLLEHILRYNTKLKQNNDWFLARKNRIENKINELVTTHLLENFWSDERKSIIQEHLKKSNYFDNTPYQIFHKLLNVK